MNTLLEGFKYIDRHCEGALTFRHVQNTASPSRWTRRGWSVFVLFLIYSGKGFVHWFSVL